MPTDKKTYSLDDIKPMSAMSIEPTTPEDYKGFPSLSPEASDSLFAKLETGFQQIMGTNAKMDLTHLYGQPGTQYQQYFVAEDVFDLLPKSQAISGANPDAINLPLSETPAVDLLGLPGEKTKTDVMLDRHPDAVRLPKARIERDDTLGYPM